MPATSMFVAFLVPLASTKKNGEKDSNDLSRGHPKWWFSKYKNEN